CAARCPSRPRRHCPVERRTGRATGRDTAPEARRSGPSGACPGRSTRAPDWSDPARPPPYELARVLERFGKIGDAQQIRHAPTLMDRAVLRPDRSEPGPEAAPSTAAPGP